MKRNTQLVANLLIAIFGGILSSLAFVFSPTNKINLSSIILCISGNKPSTSVMDLLSLSSMYLPLYIFCAITGTNLYRHFCTASVYVFSRQPKRIKWYICELASLFAFVLLYQLVFTTAAVLTTGCRMRVEFDQSGTMLFLYYIVVQFLWINSLSLMINILSIWFGSDLGYAIGIGTKMVLITLLTIPNFIALNPISRLVLGWHISDSIYLSDVLDNTEYALNIDASLVYMVILCITLAIICGVVVVKHDLLVSNKESGGV